jgi:hypothetical protein
MLAILATWEVETGRIMVGGQHRKKVHETTISKNNQSKMNWKCSSGSRESALQVQSPKFKP